MKSEELLLKTFQVKKTDFISKQYLITWKFFEISKRKWKYELEE